MATAFEVPADKLIKAMADELKNNLNFKRPEWTVEVKTGTHRERAPDDPEWWWTRSASVLRKLYVGGSIGSRRLCVEYGGRKHRGRKPEEFRKASGKIIRVILQQFDELGFTQKDVKTKSGRTLTPKGRSFVDKTASKIARENV